MMCTCCEDMKMDTVEAISCVARYHVYYHIWKAVFVLKTGF